MAVNGTMVRFTGPSQPLPQSPALQRELTRSAEILYQLAERIFSGVKPWAPHPAMGARLYAQAAEWGHPGAMIELAVCLTHGDGLPVEQKLAAALCYMAAERGYFSSLSARYFY